MHNYVDKGRKTVSIYTEYLSTNHVYSTIGVRVHVSLISAHNYDIISQGRREAD